ncbi:MAG: acyltransferase [Desulfovibrio sp.]|jgi:galactoside O-acetyltransferase|nr:acyltransferase [Desulfovibrio sp.]
MTLTERLALQGEECWRLLWGWIPGGCGTLLRRFFYRPLFCSAGPFRSGVGVVVQGFANISMGRGCGLNRHCSLYASRGKISMGDNVFLGDFSSINANDAHVRIGSQVAIGPMCLIQGANHAFDRLDLPITGQGHVPAEVVIEDNVWIGAHAVILPGTRIGAGAVIAAGAVVSRDVPPDTVAAGVPARPMRARGRRRERDGECR